MLLQHYHTFTNLVTILVLRPPISQKVLSFALGNSLDLTHAGIFLYSPPLNTFSSGISSSRAAALLSASLARASSSSHPAVSVQGDS